MDTVGGYSRYHLQSRLVVGHVGGEGGNQPQTSSDTWKLFLQLEDTRKEKSVRIVYILCSTSSRPVSGSPSLSPSLCHGQTYPYSSISVFIPVPTSISVFIPVTVAAIMDPSRVAAWQRSYGATLQCSF